MANHKIYLNRAELLEAGFTPYKVSRCRGYVSRKADPAKCPARPYSGKYGAGYTVMLPAFDSTRYAVKEYYIIEGEAE